MSSEQLTPNARTAALRKSMPAKVWRELLHNVQHQWPPGGPGLWLSHQPEAVRNNIDRLELQAFVYRYRQVKSARGTYEATPQPDLRQRLQNLRDATFPLLRTWYSTGRNSVHYYTTDKDEDVRLVVHTQPGDQLKAEAPSFNMNDVTWSFHLRPRALYKLLPVVLSMPKQSRVQILNVLQSKELTLDTGLVLIAIQCRYIKPSFGFQVRHYDGWLAWPKRGSKLYHDTPNRYLRALPVDTYGEYLVKEGSTCEAAVAKLGPVLTNLQISCLNVEPASYSLRRLRQEPEAQNAQLSLRWTTGGSEVASVLRKIVGRYNCGKPRMPGYAVMDVVYSMREEQPACEELVCETLFRIWLRELITLQRANKIVSPELQRLCLSYSRVFLKVALAKP